MRHLELILDQSGSMRAINESTYAGARELLSDLSDDGTVRLNTFSSLVQHGTLMGKAEAIRAFQPGECDGTTALYDAICMSMYKLLNDPPAADANGVTISIITDGVENASRVFNKSNVRDAIAQAHDKGWRVTFLGANQDAVMTAESFGVRAERALTYGTTDGEVRRCFRALSASNRRYANNEDDGFTQVERTASMNAPNESAPDPARCYRATSRTAAPQIHRWVSIDPRSGELHIYNGSISAALDAALQSRQASVPVDEYNAMIHLRPSGEHIQRTATGERDVRRVAIGNTIQVKLSGDDGHRIVPAGDRVILIT